MTAIKDKVSVVFLALSMIICDTTPGEGYQLYHLPPPPHTPHLPLLLTLTIAPLGCHVQSRVAKLIDHVDLKFMH